MNSDINSGQFKQYGPVNRTHRHSPNEKVQRQRQLNQFFIKE